MKPAALGAIPRQFGTFSHFTFQCLERSEISGNNLRICENKCTFFWPWTAYKSCLQVFLGEMLEQHPMLNCLKFKMLLMKRKGKIISGTLPAWGSSLLCWQPVSLSWLPLTSFLPFGDIGGAWRSSADRKLDPKWISTGSCEDRPAFVFAPGPHILPGWNESVQPSGLSCFPLASPLPDSRDLFSGP